MNMTHLIEEEFNKNPTLTSLLKKWHQENSIDKKELYHLKMLYKENLEYIKNFKMSVKQFESFDDFYTSLQNINSKTRRVFNHPFFYLKESVFKNFLEENNIPFFISETGNLIASIETFEQSQIVSPAPWCISDRKSMFNDYTKGSGKVFITFDKKNNSIIGTSISHVLISFNEFNEQVETPKEILPIIKPLVYKNYFKSLLKTPLFCGALLSSFVLLLFSEVLIGDFSFDFQPIHGSIWFFSTLFIGLGFSLLVSPPNISKKTREFFVFFSFILTICCMVGSILCYITLNRQQVISEMDSITQNTGNISAYNDWHHENNIYYKNVPEFLSYNNEKITCDRDILNVHQNLTQNFTNVVENRKYCYFSD
jgi:hypothetical protein